MTTLAVDELPLEPLPEPVQVQPQLVSEAEAGEANAGGAVAAALDATHSEANQTGSFDPAGAPIQSSGPAAPLVTALVPTIMFVVAALLVGSLRRRRK